MFLVEQAEVFHQNRRHIEADFPLEDLEAVFELWCGHDDIPAFAGDGVLAPLAAAAVNQEIGPHIEVAVFSSINSNVGNKVTGA